MQSSFAAKTLYEQYAHHKWLKNVDSVMDNDVEKIAVTVTNVRTAKSYLPKVFYTWPILILKEN